MSGFFHRCMILAIVASAAAAPSFAENTLPPGAEQTAKGTLIWPAQKQASPPAHDDSTIIWDDAKTPRPQGSGTPDRNGIIWNDAAKDAKPPRTHEAKSDGPCKDFTGEVTIEGQRQATRGTACQQPDGRWRIVSQSKP